jgi:hypothetical protein
VRWLVVVLLLLSVAAAWLWWWPADIAPVATDTASRASVSHAEGVAADPRLATAADPAPEQVATDELAAAATRPAAVEVTAPGPVESVPAAGDRGPLASFLVLDEHGAPIGGACVTAIDGEHDLASGFANATGELLLRGPEAPFDFRVTAKGYLPATGRAEALSTTRVVLATAPVLRGRVFDPAGAPLYGARVQLLAPVADRRTAPRTRQERIPLTYTERDGTFAIPWPDAAARDVVIDLRRYAPFVARALTSAAQGDALLVVTLQPGVVVQGTARRADGSPLTSAWVEVWSTTPASARPRFGERMPWREHELLGRSLTGGDGTFEVKDLPAGTGVAVELAPEHAAEPWFGALTAGTVTRVDFRAQEFATVRGTVADWVHPTQVFLYGGDRRMRWKMVGADGTFEFRDVPPHTYRIGVTMPPIEESLHLVAQDWILGTNSGLAAEITLAAGEERTVALRRPPPGTGAATGTATVGGLPAVSCQIVFRPANGEGALVRRAVVDAAGDFGCEGLRAGDYDVELRSADGEKVLAKQACRVRPGWAVRVTLTAP